jgi:O-antigen ligase
LTVDPKNMDITNNYIMQGIMGGILGLGLFLAIIISCFKIAGRLVRKRDLPLHPKLVWTFGVCVACHSTAMISISYFDQIQVFWFWLLAVFASFAVLTQKTAFSVRRPELPVQAMATRREIALASGQSDAVMGRWTKS